MNELLIIISIFVPLLFAAWIMSFAIIWFNSMKKKFIPKKVTNLATFDLNGRKYFLDPKINFGNKVFKQSLFKKWNNFNNILKIIGPKPAKKFLELFSKLEKGSKKEMLEFYIKDFNFNKTTTKMKFTFNKIKDETDFLLTMHYNVYKNPQNQKKSLIKKIEKNSIISNVGEYIGFLAFNILGNFDKNYLRLVKILSLLKNSQKITYFVSEKKLILLFFGSSNRKVEKKLNKLLDLIEKKGFSKGINQLYEGAAIAISKKSNSISNINKIIQVLTFLISESIRKKKNFTKESEDLKQEDFFKFTKASNSFSKIIKSENMETLKTPILSWNNNKKIVDYIFPKIQKIDKTLLKNILANIHNKKSLVNSHANKIISKQTFKEPVLLDVYDSWVYQHRKKIKTNNILFVVHFDKYKFNDEQKLIMQELSNKKVPFAIHIKTFDETVATLLQTTKPKFIIIDEIIWGGSDSLEPKEYMKLMSLNSLVQKNNFKLIYQNPSHFIDDKIAKQIGLSYYYKKI